jgi:hypothetical protein
VVFSARNQPPLTYISISICIYMRVYVYNIFLPRPSTIAKRFDVNRDRRGVGSCGLCGQPFHSE